MVTARRIPVPLPIAPEMEQQLLKTQQLQRGFNSNLLQPVN